MLTNRVVGFLAVYGERREVARMEDGTYRWHDPCADPGLWRDDALPGWLAAHVAELRPVRDGDLMAELLNRWLSERPDGGYYFEAPPGVG